MAKYLLDTHTLIWYLSGNELLPPNVKALIENLDNDIQVSIVSYWEIAIKLSIEKLDLPVPLKDFITLAKEKEILTMPISEDSILYLSSLPFHHRDPFDRLLISQSIVGEIPIIGKDRLFRHYPVNQIWS